MTLIFPTEHGNAVCNGPAYLKYNEYRFYAAGGYRLQHITEPH